MPSLFLYSLHFHWSRAHFKLLADTAKREKRSNAKVRYYLALCKYAQSNRLNKPNSLKYPQDPSQTH